MKRRPIHPTNHLRAAIRKIDQVAWILHGEQLAANGAHIEAVSRGDRREILKLYRAKFTALGDRAVILQGGLAPNERHRAIRLTEYEGEMESLHEAARRLRSRMESTYLHQKRFATSYWSLGRASRSLAVSITWKSAARITFSTCSSTT